MRITGVEQKMTIIQVMEAGTILQAAGRGEAEDAHKTLAGLRRATSI